MTISVTHPVPDDGEVNAVDYHAEHLITGTPGKFLGFDEDGNATELTGSITANPQSPFVNLADFLDPDRVPFVTDDLPAFTAALAAVTVGGLGNRLLIPQGKYCLSDTLTVEPQVYFQGAGSGQAGGAATLLRFANNKDGIIMGTQGSVLEGVQLWGGNVQVNGSGTATSFAGGDSPTGWGVKVEDDFIEVRDVQVTCFGSGGFLANADGAAQANSAVFYRCQAIYNGGHGFLLAGTDGNAGGTMFCSAIDNAGCGFYDYSFLGNAHYSNHTRGNGMVDPTGCNNPTGATSYAGAGWYVMAGQETAASTTVPGTNAAVWAPFPTAPWGSFKPWVTGMTWILGASYATNVSNQNSYNCLFSNPYAEQSQPNAQIHYPAQIHGGLIADGNVGSAPQLQAGSNAFGAGAWRTIATAAGRYSYLGAPAGLVDADTAYGWHDGTNAWRMRSDGVMMRAGGAIYQIAATGFNLAAGMGYQVDGTKVVGARGAAVADATDAASAITQLNALLARCRAHGLIV